MEQRIYKSFICFTCMVVGVTYFNSAYSQAVTKTLFGKTIYNDCGKEIRDSLIFYDNQTVKFLFISPTHCGLKKVIGYGQYKLMKKKDWLILKIKTNNQLNINENSTSTYRCYTRLDSGLTLSDSGLTFHFYTNDGNPLNDNIYLLYNRTFYAYCVSFGEHIIKNGFLRLQLDTFPADSMVYIYCYGFQPLSIKLNTLINKNFDIILCQGFTYFYINKVVSIGIIRGQDSNIEEENISLGLFFSPEKNILKKLKYKRRKEQRKQQRNVQRKVNIFDNFDTLEHDLSNLRILFDQKGYENYLKNSKKGL